jgi:hypothetical protein
MFFQESLSDRQKIFFFFGVNTNLSNQYSFIFNIFIFILFVSLQVSEAIFATILLIGYEKYYSVILKTLLLNNVQISIMLLFYVNTFPLNWLFTSVQNLQIFINYSINHCVTSQHNFQKHTNLNQTKHQKSLFISWLMVSIWMQNDNLFT